MINERDLIKLTEEEARNFGEQNGFDFYVIRREGSGPYMATSPPPRVGKGIIYAALKDGIVIEATAVLY